MKALAPIAVVMAVLAAVPLVVHSNATLISSRCVDDRAGRTGWNTSAVTVVNIHSVTRRSSAPVPA